MNELALFAGAGGGILGSHLLGWRTVCAVEVEPYRREVLLRRQRDGVLPLFPIWDDVRTFNGTAWRGTVDVVTAGFPCQPFSVAGKRRGADDERNLWPETIRIIREVRPRYALLENVPGLLGSGYFGRILGDLDEAGYDTERDCISAAECGANHRRERLWILAYASEIRRESQRDEAIQGSSTAKVDQRGMLESVGMGRESESIPASMAHAAIPRRYTERSASEAISQPGAIERSAGCGSSTGSWWSTEPALGRVAHGVAHRVDRLAAIGDGQVPGVVRAAWERLR